MDWLWIGRAPVGPAHDDSKESVLSLAHFITTKQSDSVESIADWDFSNANVQVRQHTLVSRDVILEPTGRQAARSLGPLVAADQSQPAHPS